MFGPSCSLFWHIDIENLLIRLKAVMVSLKTSENEDSDKFHFMEQYLKEVDEIVESSKYFR